VFSDLIDLYVSSINYRRCLVYGLSGFRIGTLCDSKDGRKQRYWCKSKLAELGAEMLETNFGGARVFRRADYAGANERSCGTTGRAKYLIGQAATLRLPLSAIRSIPYAVNSKDEGGRLRDESKLLPLVPFSLHPSAFILASDGVYCSTNASAPIVVPLDSSLGRLAGLRFG
jgi:hypothetical protein